MPQDVGDQASLPIPLLCYVADGDEHLGNIM